MANTLTPEQRQKYLEHRGVRCPFCDNDEISSGPSERDDDYVTIEVECHGCDGTWLDYYTLTDVLNADGSPVPKETHVP